MITLHMIVRDEEKLLPTCLKSVRDFVDEIIVVDTGSVDSTVDIAKHFGARVERFDWVDDFSRARNFALSFVRTPWTIWLDADDMVLNPHIIQQSIQTAHKRQCQAVWSMYKQDETSYQRRLQIFKPKFFKWEGVVHENPIAKRPHMTMHDFSELVIQHRKPMERRPEAAVKYLEILLEKDPTNWLGLAESYRYLASHPDIPENANEYRKASEHYYWEAAHDKDVNDGTKYMALFNCAKISMELAGATKDIERLKFAMMVAKMAHDFLSERAEAIIILGQIADALGHKDDAKHYYELALTKKAPDEIGLVYHEYYSRIPQNLLKHLERAA
jgi:glycosyltransferase involved in cell wall biosynthesis